MCVWYLDCCDKMNCMKGELDFRNCIDSVHPLNEVVQGRLEKDKVAYASILGVKKVYIVWCDGLLLKLGVRGKV